MSEEPASEAISKRIDDLGGGGQTWREPGS